MLKIRSVYTKEPTLSKSFYWQRAAFMHDIDARGNKLSSCKINTDQYLKNKIAKYYET